MMTREWGDFGCSSLRVSSPERPGIFKSRRIRSGMSRSSASSNASPESNPLTWCCRRDNRLTSAERMAGSSSVTKIEARIELEKGGHACLLSQRQPDAQSRAVPGLAGELNVARMRLDDIATDRQSQSGAFTLPGGKKRLKDVGHILRGNAHAGV